MKKVISLVGILFIHLTAYNQHLLQLAPPRVKYESVFLSGQSTVMLAFAMPGAVIRYTTDGSLPNAQSTIYSKPISLSPNSPTKLNAISFCNGFQHSEPVSVTFLPQGKSFNILSVNDPHENYRGIGANSLNDNESGNSSDLHKQWLGFQIPVVRADLKLKKKSKVKSVMLHILSNEGAWIFPPERVVIKDGAGNFITSKIIANHKLAGPQPLYIEVDSKKKLQRLQLEIYPLSKIPSYHPGKGTPGWFFIDEIKVY